MALTRLLPRPNTRMRTDRGPALARVIAFANQKGGVAKTTTTLNLSVALAEQGEKVLAIDLDPQGNLTMSQGWNPDEIDRSMFDRRLLHSREAVEILKENFGDLVLNTKIRKTVRYAEAPVKGQSIFKYDPSGEAASMYRDLAKEVLNGTSARQHA